jgi:hypothetical protein
MSMTYGAAGLRQTAASTHRTSGFFEMLEYASEAAPARRLRAVFCDLSDRNLKDIGAMSGEIDLVASSRNIDLQGSGACRYAASPHDL